MSPEKIGPYEILGLLGRGGMGSVYRGQHEETGNIHAIKVLAQAREDDEHFRQRFNSEIQSLLKLNHPNIVKIISYGQEKGNLYFSMELVEGDSLLQLQKKKHSFDWRQILAITKAVAHGLRHAHDRGVIHRDLKPGNLLMPIDAEGNFGDVKITDFGIAKQFGDSQNTGDNILGTMDFMSPEQAKGEPVTFRSDLYSLGTVLFTLLAGKPPFCANSVEESLRNLTRVPPPRIRTFVPTIPDAIDKLIYKLMSKQPEKRTPTAQALLYKIKEIEEKLKTSSEAQTAQLPIPEFIGDTFDAGDAGNNPTKIDTGRALPANQPHERNKDRNVTDKYQKQTIEFTKPGSADEKTARHDGEDDYYNRVADQMRQRERKDAEIQAPSRRGVLPMLVGLLAILGLAGYGIYQSYQPPPADQLYSQIQTSVDRPHRVLKEIGVFLKHYPDDARFNEVAQMQDVGAAIAHYNRLTNTLSVRSNIPGENRLTEVEKQFLEIVELSKDNKELALKKMNAFITVHDNDLSIDQRDAKCLEAAKNYRVKIRHDAHTLALWNLEKIGSAVEGAEKIDDPVKAAAVYRSILELHKETELGALQEDDESRAYLILAKEKFKEALFNIEEEKRQREIEKSESPETETVPDDSAE